MIYLERFAFSLLRHIYYFKNVYYQQNMFMVKQTINLTIKKSIKERAKQIAKTRKIFVMDDMRF